jgi:branched-chain amino acid transport system substrate-binding protein
VTAGGETGAEIKIGFVTPQTGGLASFGVPDAYCADRAREVIGEGVLGGDGKVHPVTIIIKDSQSDSNRAAQVTGDLINNDQVDVIVAASTPDTTSPVADQGEANGIPTITNDTPWQSFIATRSGGNLDAVYKWTYHTFWGLEDVQADFLDMWSQVSNNKVVGAMFPNDADGNAWLPGWQPVWEPNGYTAVIPSQFQNGTEDFTSQISEFKKVGAEIGVGVFLPPDFTNFWKQSIQQGWIPKLATYAKALLFPQSVEALGPIANNLTTEVWWTPSHPFTSSLLGETAKEFADEFTRRTQLQWTQPLLHFIIFEMAVDAIKRAPDPKNKEDIIAAVKVTKLDTIGGPIDFSAPVEPAGPPWQVGPRHIVENVYKTPLVGGQWRIGTQYPFELTIVSNKAGEMIPVQDSVQAYTGE